MLVIFGEEMTMSSFGVENVSGFGVVKFLREASTGAICSWLGGGGEGCLMVLSDV